MAEWSKKRKALYGTILISEGDKVKCRLCQLQLKYFKYMASMLNHIKWKHPEKAVEDTPQLEVYDRRRWTHSFRRDATAVGVKKSQSL